MRCLFSFFWLLLVIISHTEHPANMFNCFELDIKATSIVSHVVNNNTTGVFQDIQRNIENNSLQTTIHTLPEPVFWWLFPKRET